MVPKNTICIWYDGAALEAAQFYAATFPDSAVGAVHRAPSDYPAGQEGDVLTVEFTVMGIPCLGLNGGPGIQHTWAFSFPVAAWLARRIGLVNTMVYTHIPSSLCLIFAAVAPGLEWALVLLSIRAALSQMDVPTRSSYVMAVVTPAERAAAAGVTSVPRSLAASASPVMAGALYEAGFEAWPFFLCGVLKILYDLALLWTCRHVRPPEEQS